ncbi:MAG: hypothetical protein IT260_18250 [Saprospiraceae bacterium]|nr:hypothetical protein [Saprospiraceae bacterium]
MRYPTLSVARARLLCCLAGCLLLSDTALRSQCVQVSTLPNSKTQFTSSGLPVLNDYFTQPNTPDTAFYWGFWLLGNGEYVPQLIRKHAATGLPKRCWENYPQHNPPVFAQDYGYPAADVFEPFLYVLRRKGDPPPPAVAGAAPLEYSPAAPCTPPATFSAALAATPTARLQDIQPGKRIFLAHSHGYLAHTKTSTTPGEKSVFVVSYQPNTDCPEGKVHLLYGSINNRSFPGAAGPSGHFATATQSRNPKYGAVQTQPFSPTAVPASLSARFARHDVFSFDAAYGSAVRGVVGNAGEFRLFQEVEYEDPTPLLGPTDQSYALAILTASNANCPVVANAELYENLEMDPVQPMLGNEYVVDVDTLYLKSGEPIDPNHLDILELCACGNQSKLRFRLSVKNTGANLAEHILVHLNPLGTSPAPLAFCTAPSTQRAGTPLQWNHCTHTLDIDMSLAGGSPLRPGETLDIDFSMMAAMPANTLGGYLSKISVLGGDVTFLPGTTPIGFVNATLEIPAANPEQCDCNCVSWPLCIPIWAYVVLGLLAAGIVGVVLYKKFNPKSAAKPSDP